jgi:DNA adenine methylase
MNGELANERPSPNQLKGTGIASRVEEAAQTLFGSNNEGRDGELQVDSLTGVGRAIPEAQPFLKWVGGKAQLLAQFDSLFPKQIDGYFEPFIGGGAVFFHLKHRFPQIRARLCDINDELINTYQAVRDFPLELMQRLDDHLTSYNSERERYYYPVRSQHQLPRTEIVERAARMIFLNKTCFNGLWRVNGRGEFNVPIGSHKNPALYDRENILAASAALQGAMLATRDFRSTLTEANAGDFAYVDPPYAPVSKTANFTSYAKEDFGPPEQQELAAVFTAAAKRGVRLMLSNSDVPLIRDLYHGFTIHTVSARRAINRDGAKRGAVNEVLVCAGD